MRTQSKIAIVAALLVGALLVLWRVNKAAGPQEDLALAASGTSAALAEPAEPAKAPAAEPAKETSEVALAPSAAAAASEPSSPFEPNASQMKFVGDYGPPLEQLTIWTRTPPRSFGEAYSVGNGRIGATIFGGVPEEHIVLNESSMWSGGLQDPDRADAAQKLPEIEKLLQAGKNAEAEKLMNQAFTCTGAGGARGQAKDAPFGCYQALADMDITFLNRDGTPMSGEIKNYRSTLDVNLGAAYTRYEHEGAAFVRRMFASFGDQVLVYRIAVDKNRRISFDLKLNRKERAKTEPLGSNGLVMTGKLSDGKGGDGIAFNATLMCEQRGGKVTNEGGVLHVREADIAILVIGMGTSYAGPVQGPWQGRDHLALTQQSVVKALGRGYEELWKTQMNPHWIPLFQQRSQIDFGSQEKSKIPTPERLTALARGESDPALEALYFQYGRYLVMGTAHAGQLAPGSMGLWTGELQTPSNGDYRLDGGTEMNYSPMGCVQFPEIATSLGPLVSALVEPGQRTAKAYYGANKGWVAHTLTNPWGFTAPGEDASLASITGGAWLASQAAQVFLYTRDTAQVLSYYPAMKGAAEFFLETLVEEPTHKWLVTPVSTSPNAFKGADGKLARVCMGPTIDQEIVRDLFANVAELARAQSVDLEFAKKLDETRARLAPIQVGKGGAIQEWLEDREPADPQAFPSALYGLYPSEQINPNGTPELARAARVTLEKAGDAGSASALAWKAAMWARLGDGERAHKLLLNLLKPVTGTDGSSVGTYPNLRSAGPNLEIGGNLVALSAMSEMLVQSYREKPGEEYTIQMLPAFPKAWKKKGSIHGVAVKGGMVISVHWDDEGILEEAHIYRVNSVGGTVRIRYSQPLTAKGSDGSDPGAAYADGVLAFFLDGHRTVNIALAK